MPRMRRRGGKDYLRTGRAVQRLRLVCNRLRQEVAGALVLRWQQRFEGVQERREEDRLYCEGKHIEGKHIKEGRQAQISGGMSAAPRTFSSFSSGALFPNGRILRSFAAG